MGAIKICKPKYQSVYDSPNHSELLASTNHSPTNSSVVMAPVRLQRLQVFLFRRLSGTAKNPWVSDRVSLKLEMRDKRKKN